MSDEYTLVNPPVWWRVESVERALDYHQSRGALTWMRLDEKRTPYLIRPLGTPNGFGGIKTNVREAFFLCEGLAAGRNAELAKIEAALRNLPEADG